MLAKIILGGTNMKLSEVFIKNDAKYVTDENGYEYRVINSKAYNNEEYIELRNHLNTDDEPPFNNFFSGRIKDAIETIKNGDGDALQVGLLFNNELLKVIHFINREFGEEIRKQSLEGWKDAKFGWVIKFGNKHSMKPYPLNDKNEMCSPFDRDQPKIFSTREEANTHMVSLLDTAKTYAEKYSNMAVDKSEDEIDKLQDDMLHELENDVGHCDTITSMAFDMLDDKLNIVNNFKLVNYYYKFEQYLIP